MSDEIRLNTHEAFGTISPDHNREYGNVLGITGDPLTAEQEAEINAAMEGLTPVEQERLTKIVASWLHTHHGPGMFPNVRELAKAVKNGL